MRPVALLFAAALLTYGEQPNDPWARPVPPVHIAGNVYYVGSVDLACFLVTTPRGHILINTGFQQMVPGLRASVEKLGFRFSDIRYLLASHVHEDHVAGFAAVRAQTHANVAIMAGDADILEHGGKGDFLFDGRMSWPPCPVDRVLHDGDTISLGGTTLTAHLTPGHTKGCTTWTTTVTEAGRPLQVVIIGSTSINPGTKLVHNPKYPAIAADYERTFRTLRALPCDVFLAAHASQFGMAEKLKRLNAGAKENPFIDPQGYRAFVDRTEAVFNEELARQTGAGK